MSYVAIHPVPQRGDTRERWERCQLCSTSAGNGYWTMIACCCPQCLRVRTGDCPCLRLSELLTDWLPD
eukprot:13166082-Alexandrium_andersonii.AAC.1